MTIEVHILDASAGRLPESDRRIITDVVYGGVNKAKKLLHIDNVDILIKARRGINEESTGFADAFCTDPHTVELTIDADYPYYRYSESQIHLSSVVVHELHHAKRGRKINRDDITVGGALVEEGLAKTFQIETGHPAFFHSPGIYGDEMEDFSKRILAIVDDRLTFENCREIFMGGSPDHPVNGGYMLGYALIRGWLDKKSLTAAEAVETEAQPIIEMWKEGQLLPDFEQMLLPTRPRIWRPDSINPDAAAIFQKPSWRLSTSSL